MLNMNTTNDMELYFAVDMETGEIVATTLAESEEDAQRRIENGMVVLEDKVGDVEFVIE